MPSSSDSTATTALVDSRAAFATALGDDALIAAQRLIEWVARAPEIEEDVALANVALDLLGQARMLLSYAGSLTTPPQTEDDLAYLRPAADFRNAVLVERENGDFAVTMTRLLLFSAYQGELYAALRDGTDEPLAAIAAKAIPEVRYHRDHARLWVLRLGDGTATSHQRAQAALDAEWAWFEGLFAPVGQDPGKCFDPAPLFDPARAWATRVLTEATLDVPPVRTAPFDGRRGEHTPALGILLAELQQVARAHPGASW